MRSGNMARGGGPPDHSVWSFPPKNLESEEFTHEGEFLFFKVISQDADTAGNTIGSIERKKHPGSLFPIISQPFAG